MAIKVNVIGQYLGLSYKAMRVIRTLMATAGPVPSPNQHAQVLLRRHEALAVMEKTA